MKKYIKRPLYDTQRDDRQAVSLAATEATDLQRPPPLHRRRQGNHGRQHPAHRRLSGERHLVGDACHLVARVSEGSCHYCTQLATRPAPATPTATRALRRVCRRSLPTIPRHDDGHQPTRDAGS